MKKIIAVLISLLFVGSTFGIGAIMAPPLPICGPGEEINIMIACLDSCSDPESCKIYGPTAVQAGDIITVKVENQVCGFFNIANIDCDYFELLDFDFEHIEVSDCTITIVYTLRALRPGTVGATFDCNGNKLNLTVIPKEYPMHQFLKILEKNKNK
ncbi:MAG: hypothetical protein KO464_04570 [Candidatus Methanofastidiosum sp.]|nr:hypothetical protein [Methanofastidiosum sp.]